MPRGDAMHGVGVVRDLDLPTRQLLPKSYRARTAAQHGFGQRRDPFSKLLGRAQRRAPQPLAARRVERGGHLAAAGIEHHEAAPARCGLAKPPPQRIQSADSAERQSAAQPQRPRRRDANPQTGEGAGTDADRKPADRLPATSGLRRSLDLCQQRGRVLRPALLGETEQCLVDDLTPARRRDGGVAGRGVEPDYGQRLGTKKLKMPTRFPSTNHVTLCLPGMLVVILLTYSVPLTASCFGAQRFFFVGNLTQTV